MCKPKIGLFSLVLLFLFSFVLLPLYGDAYLITGSEITQILDECETLKAELSILKGNSQADKASLKRLGENLTMLENKLSQAEQNLTNTQDALTSARGLLDEAKTQLKELEASLKQSKRAALWQNIKVGGVCFGVGAAIGFIVGAIMGAK